MPQDTVATISPVDPWADVVFLRDLRDRFNGDVGSHLGELTEEEKARLERLNEKLKARHSWRRF